MCRPYITQDGYDSGLILYCDDILHTDGQPLMRKNHNGSVSQTYDMYLDEAAHVHHLHQTNPKDSTLLISGDD